MNVIGQDAVKEGLTIDRGSSFTRLKRLRRLADIRMLLLAYFLFGLAFSIVNPIFESPDELLHYRYIRTLLDTRALPVQNAGELSESHQPPLYYAMAALATAGVPDDGTIPQVNPFWNYDPYGADAYNKNLYLHTAAERFPYRGTALAVQIVRWLSLALGGLTVYASYRLLGEVFTGRPYLVLGALSFVVFNPQFLFISSSINNDNLAILAGALMLWWSVRVVQTGPTLRLALVGGLLLAVALLSKASAGALVMVMLAAIGLSPASRTSRLRTTFAVLAVAAALAGWWFVGNIELYGDWLGLDTMLVAWGRRAPLPLVENVASQAQELWYSYWGKFGYGQIALLDGYYVVLAVAGLLALAGLVKTVVESRRSPGRRNVRLALVMAASPFSLLAALAYFGSVNPSGVHGRFLLPAIPALSAGLFAGLRGLSRLPDTRLDARYAALTTSGMAALSLVALFGYLMPVYSRPPLLTFDEARARTRPLDIVFGDQARLLGYALDRDRVLPGELVTLTLCWQALARAATDYYQTVQLIDPATTARVAQYRAYTGQGRFLSTQWSAGDIFCDGLSLRVEAWAPAPRVYSIEVALVDPRTRTRLNAMSPAGVRLNPAVIAPIKVRALAPVSVPSPLPEPVDFGGQIELMGWAPETISARAGQTATLTLYWRARQVPAADYTVFVHVLDESGQKVTQADAPPQSGAYPTSFWDAGEVVADVRAIALPANARPGMDTIWIGLYQLEGGQRLPADGDPAGAVRIGRLVVEAEP